MKKTSFLILVLTIIILLPINVKAEEKYEIYTKDDLIKFSNEVNNGNNFEGKTVYLMEKIDLECSEENQWIPIGISKNKTFNGIFEGNGHIISGIYINSDLYDNYGLFGTNEGLIKNIAINDFCINIENCNKSVNVGTIVGNNNGIVLCCCNFSNMNFTVNSSVAYTYLGGIVGCDKGQIAFCYNIGKINLNIKKATQICMGSIVGHMNEGALINNCYNIGNISADNIENTLYYGNGGIAGHHLNGEIKNCYYLEDMAENGRGYNLQDKSNVVESIKELEMKNENFVNLLNMENTYFKFDENKINNGYPILYWEKDEKNIDNKVFLINITIDIPPTKNEYIEGEKFDISEMKVIGTYSDGTTKEITDYTYTPNQELSIDTSEILISYTEDNITKTATQKITVNKKEKEKIKQQNETQKSKTDTTIANTKIPNAGKFVNLLFITITTIMLVIGIYYLNKTKET